jgi:hypothetical protein
MENYKYLLVIGGTGNLGSAIVKVFKNNSSDWRICVMDYMENPQADKNILVDHDMQYNEEYITGLYSQIEEFSSVYNCIFNMAGGWVKGTVSSLDVFKQSQDMMSKNFYTSLLGNITIN